MNQTHKNKVVGLSYKPGEGLPTVILKAEGTWADQTLAARDPLRGPAIVQDKELVERLMQLPVHADITPDLFKPVAAILVHVLAVASAQKGKNI